MRIIFNFLVSRHCISDISGDSPYRIRPSPASSVAFAVLKIYVRDSLCDGQSVSVEVQFQHRNSVRYR